MEAGKPSSRTELRTFFKAERKRLPPEERRELSARAQRFLWEEIRRLKAETAALYVAVNGEVETDFLLRESWAAGLHVLLPLCDKERPGCMDMVPCSGPEDLRPGYCGIPEPVCPEPSRAVRPDLVVVPGLAFDSLGFRLGMGGGFYDRLLAGPEYAGAIRLGLAYSFQVVDFLPHEAWDVPVHAVCTEKGVVWTQSPSP